MKFKKCLITGLCLAMTATTFYGCGSSESAQTEGTSGQTAAEASTALEEGTAGGSVGGESAAGEGSNENGEITADWEDMAEVNMVLIAPGAVPPGLAEVEAALNGITEAQINTHVNLEMLEMGNYIQQLSLKMTSGEQVDLVMTFPGGSATFNALQSQGQLMDITDLLEQYGQPVLDTVGEYIKATTVDGRIYGVPVYRDYSSAIYMVMRTDVLEDLGLMEQAQNIQSLSDVEAILEAVHSSEKWSYLTGLASAAGNGSIGFFNGTFTGIDDSEHIYFDSLGNADLIFTDPTGADPTVQLLPATQAYKSLYETVHSWYESGYIYKDAATSTEAGYDLIKTDKGFGLLISGELGMEAAAAQATQMDVTCVKLADLPISTTTCTMFSWAVPNSAKYPEAAVALMSLLYTSPEINNILAWGVEGRDYVIEDGFAKFPEGQSDVPYHSSDYITGNQFLVTPWDGQPADIRQQAKAAVDHAVISAYLGFTCDTTNIANEISAVNNVVAEFSKQINSGVAKPEVLDAYIEKLEQSGVQKIIDEYQVQLDAFLAAK